MVGKVLIIIFALFLFFGYVIGYLGDGIKDWRSDPYTESFLAVTAGGVTSANVTLSYDLYQAKTANVARITSSNGGDTPVASAYDEDNIRLTISGLAAGTSRTLTTTYDGETDDPVMRIIGPFILAIIVLIVLYALFHGVLKKGRG